jgi:outer membrane receptor protein involved in Fe transport
LKTLNDLDSELGSEDVSWGTFSSLMAELGRHHRLNLIAFRSQLADNETQTFDGFWSNADATLHATRLRFVSRALNVLQLHGASEFDALAGGKLDWNLSYSVAARDEPNTRDVVYQLNPNLGAYSFVDGSESGRHFFSSQSEKAYGFGVDWTQPLLSGARATSLKLGGLVSVKGRELGARRFAFRRVPGSAPGPFICPGTTYNETCPDSLFVPDHIGTALRLQENTRPEDAYTAGLNVFAAYVMTDASLARDLRLIVGERIEVTRQSIEPFDQFSTGANVRGADLKSTDQLPAAALVYDATSKTKLRLAVARTLARPQLRELAPFAYSDFFGGRLTSGNPDLALTRVTNADLRLEHFPKLSEVLAVSLFYKHFKDPIEPVVTPSGDSGLVTFQNAEGASLVGVEMEARLGLDHLSSSVRGLSLVSNLTLARSRIEVRQTDIDFLTNTSRPMANQAPYVLNVALDYESERRGLSVRLLYNVNGARLVEVGTEGLDDAYEHPRHRLDFVAAKDLDAHFQVKLSAVNLIDAERVVTIGKEMRDDRVTLRYRDGRSFLVGASWKY